MQDFAALWGMGTSKESNRWQWEAPSLSPSKDTTDSIPFWLTEHDRKAVGGPISRQEDDKPELHIAPQSNAGDDLKRFRDLMRSGIAADSVLEVCGSFCQRFKQSLSLGQVSTDIIASSIREVPSDIRNNAANKDLEDAACMSFYHAIWEGILACRVLQPAELGLDVLRLLLTRLPRLPVHLSGMLLTDILNSITDCQKRGLKQEICAIGTSCFASFTKVFDSQNLSTSSQYGCPRYPSSRNEAALDVKVMENLVQALVESVGVYSSEKANKHVRDLACASTAYVAKVIFSNYTGPLRELKEMRKAWLEFISRIPYGSEKLLVEACMILEAEDHNSGLKIVPQLSVHGLCDVLLEHWANKTPGTSMLNAHTTFKAAILKQGSADDSIVHLCRALEQHSIPWHKEVRCLLQILRRLRGVTASSYFCLRRLEDAQIYLDATILADELAALSSNNIGHARDLFDRYSKGRPPTYSLALECFPDLVVAMINSSCNPDEIWQALGGRKIWKEERINKARIRLVKRMALEFSQAKFISTRVAFRNVVRCYRYLSYHGVPISSDIARILTYIGIERNILEKGSISRGRLHWALGIIARVEGVGIARRMETAVISAQDREKNLRTRDQNPLKLGPID